MRYINGEPYATIIDYALGPTPEPVEAGALVSWEQECDELVPF